MGAEGTSMPCGALQGLRGVHLMQHSPFAVQEIHQNEDCNLSSSERSQINVVNQSLLVWCVAYLTLEKKHRSIFNLNCKKLISQSIFLITKFSKMNRELLCESAYCKMLE